MSELDPVMSMVFSDDLKFSLFSRLTITMVLGPMVSIYIMKVKGMIDSIHMPSLRGRSMAYGITLMYYVFTYLVLRDVELPRVMYGMIFGLMSTLILLILISFRFKISAHMIGMGGALGAVLWVFWMFGMWSVPWGLGLLFVSALVASSRLYLQAHTLLEVASGFILGVGVIFGTLYAYVA